MPVQRSYGNATPIDLLLDPSPQASSNTSNVSQEDAKIRDYVLAWRNKLRTERIEKVNVWNECWALYRGQEDFSNKEDWQSKIVLPKSFGTVKQAVNMIKRLLNLSKKPYRAQPENPDDPVWNLRAEKITDLSKVFLDKAHFMEEFSVGLETGFIMGLGVWKMGWDVSPRTRLRVQTALIPGIPGTGLLQAPPQEAPLGAPGAPTPMNQPGVMDQQPTSTMAPGQIGQSRQELPNQQASQYPTQLPMEALLPPGSLNASMGGIDPIMIPTKQIVKEEVMEGHLTINAVDPYFFYWLPGSKLNNWTGTIEEIEVPKWQLLEMAYQGAFSPELIQQIGPMNIQEYQRQTYLRFGEMPRGPSGPNDSTGTVKLTEFYGPVVIDGKVIEKHGHVIIANDTWVLKNGSNDKWFNAPPYCAFSPLQLPFRTEGVGLVEMVRHIDRGLNQIINMGVDTLLFRLMPLFEYTPDIYENPEDLRNGITPGKLLRRNQLMGNQDIGIKPIEFNDVSPGAHQVAGILDRAHQEGGFVSELQQSLPRWSGAQTATETESIQQNQNSFFGSLAADIEQMAMAPMIKMAIEIMMQYIDTANDPRIAAVLGVDEQVLAGMSHPEIYEMINGDYQVKVTGITDNIDKAEMLQNLVQLMNIIGQNPEAWLPYINQDALLRRILESFRPNIHDIEQIISDPQTVMANKAQQAQKEQMAQMATLLPQLAQMAQDSQHKQAEMVMRQSEHEDAQRGDAIDRAIAMKQAAQKAATPK